MNLSVLLFATIFSFYTTIWDDTTTLFDQQRKSLLQFANDLFGEYRLFFLGINPQEHEVSTFGYGEISNNVRITTINGILNQKKDWEFSSKMISETHGNVNVHSLFWPSEGWIRDLHKSFFTHNGNVSHSAKALSILWRQMIEEMGGINSDGIIIHYAHSIGSLESYTTKYLMTEQELKKIKVITFGPPYIFPDEDFLQVTHYVSCMDPVCMLNPVAYFDHFTNPKAHIVFLNDTYSGLPLVDHFLAEGSYRDQIGILGAEFMQTYGFVD